MILTQEYILSEVRRNKDAARRSFTGKYEKVRFSRWELSLFENPDHPKQVSLCLIFECQGPDGVCDDCYSTAL